MAGSRIDSSADLSGITLRILHVNSRMKHRIIRPHCNNEAGTYVILLLLCHTVLCHYYI